MIRVLQCVNDMHRAGLETMLMNYYRHIDRDKIQFDFLTHRPYRSDYDDEIENLGGKIYYAPRLYPQNYPKYFKWMKSFFDEHKEYKIIHSHIDAMSYLPLKAAKKANIPIRIAHSHNTSIDKDFKYPLKQYFRKKICEVANYYCSCGYEAGEFLFPGKSFQYIPNAIEANRFLYNENIRNDKREELGWNKHFVVGHIGRLSYQKNHKFLLEIFKEVTNIDDSAILVLVGCGEKENEIRKQIDALDIRDKVFVLGNRSDVSELYQAMDIFVMPSFFEGIPVVGVEAQFSGLPCLFSDAVPKQVKFSKEVKFLSINKLDVDKWADEILKYKNYVRNCDDTIINGSEYNIENSYSILADYYMDLIERVNR